MSLKFLKPALICLLLALAVPFSAAVRAHGGLSLADDVCKLTIGPYTMHFTGYQPDNTQEKEFCEDIPATGRTVVALDYIDDVMRAFPTEIRVIRDTGSEENLDTITILHIPPKVYPNASITFEHNFSQPGKFVGLVSTTEGQVKHVSRFPFSVGEPKKTSPYLIFGISAAIGAVAFFFIRSRRKPSAGSAA